MQQKLLENNIRSLIDSYNIAKIMAITYLRVLSGSEITTS